MWGDQLAKSANPHPTNVLQTKTFKEPPLPPIWDDNEDEVEFEVELVLEFDEDVELVPSEEEADVPRAEAAKFTDGNFDTVCHAVAVVFVVGS